MKQKDLIGLIEVRFKQKNKNQNPFKSGILLSKKPYIYGIKIGDVNLWKYIKRSYYSYVYEKTKLNYFSIQNENGCTYQDALVVITGIYQNGTSLFKEKFKELEEQGKKLTCVKDLNYVTVSDVYCDIKQKSYKDAEKDEIIIESSEGSWYSKGAKVDIDYADKSNIATTMDVAIRDIVRNTHSVGISIDNLAKAATAITSTDEAIASYNKRDEERKSENMLNKLMPDLEFGKARDVRMSMYGPAFLDEEGKWLSLEKKTQDWVEVNDLIFDGLEMCYIMPIAKDEVAIGDYIRHRSDWVRVIDFDEGLRPVVEKLSSKEVVTILPTKNIFGFDFYAKLVCFGEGMFESSADEKNPFGAMLPFLMMKDSKNMKDILPMMMLMNGGIGEFDMKNPMMMLALMGDSNKDMLPLLMMMNMKK